MEAVIFCGIQASGKSTFYIRNFFRTHMRISMDQLNTRNKENLFITTCLGIHQAFVVDNTNPTEQERSRYIKLAKSKQFRVICYYFRTTPEEAIRRNANRTGKENIPEIGIRGTYNKLEVPTLDEGFDELYEVEIQDNDFTITKPNKKMTFEDKPALLLVDIQKGMDDQEYWGGNRNNPQAEENAARLLTLWRDKGLPVFHVKHNSTTPESPLAKGNPGNEIKALVKPLKDESLIEKEVNSAFIGTDLQQRLDEKGISKLVIAGLTTDHCISTTTRMAGNLGYETFLVSDATATFDKNGVNGEKYASETVHQIQLASLNDEFATVLTTEETLSRFR